MSVTVQILHTRLLLFIFIEMFDIIISNTWIWLSWMITNSLFISPLWHLSYVRDVHKCLVLIISRNEYAASGIGCSILFKSSDIRSELSVKQGMLNEFLFYERNPVLHLQQTKFEFIFCHFCQRNYIKITKCQVKLIHTFV